MVAAIGAGDVFTKGRDFAAWLGLVPKQISTGDRTILGKISRRGNRYLRVLFVQAAWVVLIKPKIWERHGLKPWIEVASSLSDLAGLGRIFALIRPFFLTGWHAFAQFPHD